MLLPWWLPSLRSFLGFLHGKGALMIYFIGFLLRRIADDFHLCLNALGGVTHLISLCGSEVRLPEQSFSHFCVTYAEN